MSLPAFVLSSFGDPGTAAWVLILSTVALNDILQTVEGSIKRYKPARNFQWVKHSPIRPIHSPVESIFKHPY